MHCRPAELPLKLDGLDSARSFFAVCLAEADRARETLWVAHLDEHARCMHVSCHAGDESGLGFPLRAILLDAARYGSAALVLAHNHPSGDPRPSTADCRATRRLAGLAEALDCALLDHLIFAGGDCTSLRRLGYL
ncbi:MAG TPA: JAB domain-containing protein [Sphingomicrobium sp.]|nr:JAB domain-containing protein [Sphingomicrobium sp.]